MLLGARRCEGEDQGDMPTNSSTLPSVLSNSASGSNTQVQCTGGRPRLAPGRRLPVQSWKPHHHYHYHHRHQMSAVAHVSGLPRLVRPQLPMPRLGCMPRM